MTIITNPHALPAAPLQDEQSSNPIAVVAHWSNGASFAGTSDRTAPVHDPASGKITKQVALASPEDADAVIAAAAAAAPAWGSLSLARRTQVLFRFRELLNERKPEAAELITSEHGKVLSDALGEVTRGQEVVEFACGLAHLLKGSFSENASTKSMSPPSGSPSAWSGSSRRSTSRRWCRCGSSPSPSPPATR